VDENGRKWTQLTKPTNLLPIMIEFKDQSNIVIAAVNLGFGYTKLSLDGCEESFMVMEAATRAVRRRALLSTGFSSKMRLDFDVARDNLSRQHLSSRLW
jgi:hypothetical protein